MSDGLADHNERCSPRRAQAREPGRGTRTLDLFLRDEAGRVCGGLLGRLQWSWSGTGWLYVSTLWVDESLRGQDDGTRLAEGRPGRLATPPPT